MAGLFYHNLIAKALLIDKESTMNVFTKLKLQSLYFLIGLCCLMFGSSAFATATIIIAPNTVISSPVTYNNVTLDMSNGSFIIRNDATLTVRNSKIKGTLSKDNPILISIEKGNINLVNNIVDIKTVGLDQHPMSQSLQYVIQTAFANVTLTDNKFTIDNPFTAGLLITSANFATNGFQILRNSFERFHGVLYLVSSNSAVVADNTFLRNTYGHIVNIGDNNQILHNKIFYSGNNRLGNAVDIINSNNTIISRNEIYTPTCHAIYLINSHEVSIDRNRIVGGITYAVNLLSFPEGVVKGNVDEYLKDYIGINKKAANLNSSNISIVSNYMGQNRFGLAATDIDNLLVRDNMFIQRFKDADARAFWTDNNILFKNVTNLTWVNNYYKEAYSQTVNGDNSHSETIIPFPETGGIHF